MKPYAILSFLMLGCGAVEREQAILATDGGPDRCEPGTCSVYCGGLGYDEGICGIHDESCSCVNWEEDAGPDADTDADADSDADSDTDSDSDTDTDVDSDADSDSDTDTGGGCAMDDRDCRCALEEEPCWPFDADLRDVGACDDGVYVCTRVDGAAPGFYQACEWYTAPVDEFCDGYDNDCDGSNDNVTGWSEELGAEVTVGADCDPEGACVDGRVECCADGLSCACGGECS